MYREIHPLRTRYYQIGVEFDIPTATLDSIKEICGQNLEHALISVIKEWLAGVGPHRNRSWWELVRAVDDPVGGNNHVLAKKIAARHPAGTS